METIQTKCFTDEVNRLAYIDSKSSWIDLWVAEDITLKIGRFKLIPLGVTIKLLKGYEAHIMSRNSIFKSFGIIQINHQGIIDETYCGDGDQWYFPTFAMRDTTTKTNDRICQFYAVEHQSALQFNEVEVLAGQDRGRIRSTGIQQLSHKETPWTMFLKQQESY